MDLCRSERWREHLSLWPLILTVTPDERRALALKRATETVLARQPESLRRAMEVAFGSLAEVLSPAGPTGDIWWIAGREGKHDLLTEAHQSVQGLD